MAAEPTRPSLSANRSAQWVGAIAFLILVAISKYDPTSFLERGTDAITVMSWFWRYKFAGVFTFFDILLGLLLLLWVTHAILVPGTRRTPFDRWILLVLGVVAVGVIGGELNRGPQDVLTDLLFSIRNYYYFAAIYLVTSRLTWTESRYRLLAALVVMLAISVTALGWWETSQLDIQYRLSKYGRLSTARDATDGVFPLFAQLFMLALLCERLPRNSLLRWALIAGALFSLYSVFTSSSKTLVALYPVALTYLAWYYRLYERRWFWPVVASGAATATIYVLFASNLAATVQDPTSALYVYSTFVNPEDFSTATRLNQVLNFVPNMLDRGAVLQGIGVGSRWHEYIPQFPEDPGAYPPHESGTGWHLGVHVPMLRIFLDFGIVGASVFLYAFWRMLRTAVQGLRVIELRASTRACVHPALMLIVYQLLVLNLAVPKTNFFAGFLLGATSGLLAYKHATSHVPLET